MYAFDTFGVRRDNGMKALILEEKHSALELVDVPKPIPGPEEALVRVDAAALNHRDVWIQKGQYAGLKYPIVPGSDGSGVVVAAGGAAGGAEVAGGEGGGRVGLGG